METINISQFVGYFGSYYPLIIPCTIALCVAIALLFDQLRLWAITYVDEGESGPYKKYVYPLLNKMMGLETKDAPDWMDGVSSSYTEGRSRQTKSYHTSLGNKYACSNYREDIKRIRGYKDKCKDVGEEKLLYNALYGVTKSNTMSNTLFQLTIYLFILAFGLLAYKFIPEITIGALVGYGVLRLARSIVRLTKRFNKHISDGHGAKDEATEEPKEA